MEKINDGGPAFPFEGGENNGSQPHGGMSLRAYLAGKALQGIMTQQGACSLDYGIPKNNARVALANADALIAKLEVKS